MTGDAAAGMVGVVVERRFDPPLTEHELDDLQQSAQRCMALHRVRWEETFLASDGSRMFCRFSAPDAESVRMALRQAMVPVDAVWSYRPLPGCFSRTPNPAGERIP